MHPVLDHPGRLRLLASVAVLVIAVALPVRAQTTAYTWDGGTGNGRNGSDRSTGTSPNDLTAGVYVDGGNTAVNFAGGFVIGRPTVDLGDAVTGQIVSD